jgi:hypothetical protein
MVQRAARFTSRRPSIAKTAINQTIRMRRPATSRVTRKKSRIRKIEKKSALKISSRKIF